MKKLCEKNVNCAGACGDDNSLQIWGGGDDSVLWLSFAQQKYVHTLKEAQRTFLYFLIM
jgi:hypothetical protein